ncbi:hypothetical protein SAMN05428957_103389 [Oryzisolibacter propanilivorax]|uniref:Uncharacterized protein n=1 Tax=Oryzisolibacter propanilivorax TaxID=1527607 RepID=A0A1G9RNI9_9BURK|nr:hypothetical protein SAMN05428957_103389 [Oryzisolibacter propanilivorax]
MRAIHFWIRLWHVAGRNGVLNFWIQQFKPSAKMPFIQESSLKIIELANAKNQIGILGWREIMMCHGHHSPPFFMSSFHLR